MTLKTIKYEHGSYKKKADGSFSIKEKSDRIGLQAETIVGFTYEVKSASTQNIIVQNDYFYPNGKTKTTRNTIETNALFGSIITIHEVKDDVIGKMVFRVSFPDHPELETLEQAFYLFDKNQGTLFQPKRFLPATSDAIAQFETRYKVALCEDYKHFLNTYNGLNLVWWSDNSVFNTQKGAYQKAAYGSGTYTQYPFYEKMTQLKEAWDWHFEVVSLFGLGNKNPRLDMTDFYMQSLFYHDDLVRYAYPIGLDGGGNAMVQIAQGKYRGKLAMIDHEVSSSMTDWIEGETGEVYAIPPEKATADGFLEDCFEYGGLTLVDVSFDDFLKQLLEKHELVYQEMKKDFGS